MKKYVLTLLLAFSLTVLHAHVILNYPQGGETFSPGQVITIAWAILIQHDTQNWDLFYSTDGGSTWNTIREDIGVDTLTYQWTIPNEPGNQVRVKVVMDNSGQNYEDESDNFTIAGSQGIAGMEEPVEFNFYPNPAKDFIYLEVNQSIKNSEVRLMDLGGREVFNRSMKGVITGKTKIALPDVRPGIYFLQLISEQGVLTKKVIVIEH